MSQKVLIPPKKETLTVDWSSSLPHGKNDLIGLDGLLGSACLHLALKGLGGQRRKRGRAKSG